MDELLGQKNAAGLGDADGRRADVLTKKTAELAVELALSVFGKKIL